MVEYARVCRDDETRHLGYPTVPFAHMFVARWSPEPNGMRVFFAIVGLN